MRTLVVGAVTVLLLLYVWERVDLVRVGYTVQQLKVTLYELERQHDELQAKLSALTSPERIAQLAAEQLGMRQPEPGQVVLVNIEQNSSAAQSQRGDGLWLARNTPMSRGR